MNNKAELNKLYEAHKKDLWCGYNNKHYDQYIYKGILLGLNPFEISDHIIAQGKPGWTFSRSFNKIRMLNYDVMNSDLMSLKTLEAFMGSDIQETSVSFDINRKLTDKEIDQTIYYCRHDVEETIKVFLQRRDEFNAMHGIVQAFPDKVGLDNIGDTEARITAKVLGCEKKDFDDEFEFFFFPCIRLKKYKYVMDWFAERRDTFIQEYADAKTDAYRAELKKEFYKQSLKTDIADIPHVFGFGGVHGADAEAVHLSESDGAGYHVDVNNYYPSMLIAHGLVTRAATNDNYQKVYKTRKELKYKQTHAETKEEAKKWKKAQLPYKKMLNALSGAMKDKTNPAYDPRNNNCMCINGQLMLLDLIEHLEVIPGFRLVQSNTDGLIIWIPDTDEAFNQMDDICYEWECRCSTELCDIRLECDSIKEIYQKDVNNYLWIDLDGGVERKGAYLKELSPLDNDLPIINKALVEYMTNKIPVRKTIEECTDLLQFQKVVKLTSAYKFAEHEYYHTEKCEMERYDDKTYRVFASSNRHDGRLLKVKDGQKREKFGGTPDHCFIDNDSMEGAKIPSKLDKKWYIDEALKRCEAFGLSGG